VVTPRIAALARPPRSAPTRPSRPGPRASAPTLLAARAALLAALLVPACGEPPAPDPPAGEAQRLSLQLLPPSGGADGPVAVPALRVELLLHPRDEPESWTVESGEVVPSAAAGFLQVQPPAHGQPIRLARRGRYELSRFNRVRLLLDASGNTLVSALLLRAGEPLASSAVVSATHLTSPGPLELPLPPLAGAQGVADQLVLHFGDTPQKIQLGSVELLDVPAAALVPAPGGAARLLGVDGESRRALGLLAGTTLEALATLPEGATLVFAYAVPAGIAQSGPPVLELDVEPAPSGGATAAGGRPAPQRYRLQLPPPGAPPWTDVELPLGLPAGSTCRVRFHLAAPGAPGAACLLTEPVVAGARPPARPSVLLVTSDTHRADHVACLAHSPLVPDAPADLATPVLDALAAEGLLFEDCFSTVNFTNPSHIALMTGLHPRDVGILDNKQPLAGAADTLAERFADAGYRTWAAVSALHLGDTVSGLGQGFERMSAPQLPQRAAAATLDVVERWLRQPDPRPVFLWLHVFDAHRPYDPPPELLARYYRGGDPFDPRLPPLSLAGPLPAEMQGLKDLAYPRAQYKAQITALDAQLARVLQHPRFRAGPRAVIADHGESLGEHDVYFNHAELYPDTLHVPLLLSWPGAPAGERVQAPVSHLDLGRTLLDLAGLTRAEFPGRSLLAPSPVAPAAPRFALASHGSSASVTQDGLHLVLTLRRGHPRLAWHQVELFDLRTDPGCLVDLLDERFEDAVRLRELLVAWLQAQPATRQAEQPLDDARLLADLAALGYVEGPAVEAALWRADGCHWCRRMNR